VAASLTIDLGAMGKQFGELRLPRSTNEAAWTNLVVPLVTIARGEGPTVLLIGGVHGDEYEGQVPLLNLARDLDPTDVSGRVIIVPCLSGDASRAGTRCWPDGPDLNRSFPGDPDGSLPEQLAHAVSTLLFPAADVVCDIHSGGRTLRFLPMSELHLVPDRELRRVTLEAVRSWNTDHHFAYIDIAGSGLLVREAERQGKVTVSTEIGGGIATASAFRITRDGVANMLRHLGVMAGEPVVRDDTLFLRAMDVEDYVTSPESGLYETAVDPGDTVRAGDLLGRIHALERPGRPAVEIGAAEAGVVCAVRAIANTRQGDVVAVVGRPSSLEELLAL
jgi:predicted deacylase